MRPWRHDRTGSGPDRQALLGPCGDLELHGACDRGHGRVATHRCFPRRTDDALRGDASGVLATAGGAARDARDAGATGDACGAQHPRRSRRTHASLRRLDRQGARGRGSRRHPRRRSAPSRPRRAGGHPAAGNPRRRRRAPRTGPGRRGMVAAATARWARRRDCVGGHGHCCRVHRRHRGDDGVPLGTCRRWTTTGRCGRRRRPDVGSTVELRASRAAGVGAADRARPSRRRRGDRARHRIHAGVVRGVVARPVG